MDFWNDNIMFVTKENEKCGFKECQSSVKIKIKHKSWNENFISELHWNFRNIYLILEF
jgi:hypothetical protein